MQVGEPVAIAPPPAPPPDTELMAELVSVTFKSSVKACHAKVTINAPHWQQGKDAEIEDDWSGRARKMHLPTEPYSKRAAVYLARGPGGGVAHEVEIKVKVTRSRNVSGDARLMGKLWGLSIEGICPTSAGEHTVTATIADAPDEIRGYRGKIAWRLWVESAAISLSLGSTLAEVYFILGRPSLPFAVSGVWAEALRFLCGRVGVAGESDRKAVAAKVTAYCHGSHGLRYDTEHGRSFYNVGARGGSFDLWRYMMRFDRSCNCYDQAAGIQALSGALGVILAWRFLAPFGFLKLTNLVGVGPCNNPFFGSDESQRIVDSASDDRTAFGNHAFVSTIANKVLDACAGPHEGTETPPEYVAASIDDTPRLYDGGHRPGRPSDVTFGRGVVKVV